MKNNLTVYKANELVEATYTLSLNEQRVLLACIAQISPNYSQNSADKFTLTAKEFSSIFELDERGTYDELLKVSRTLNEKRLIIQSPTSGADCIETNWVSGIEYTKKAGVVSVWIAQPLLPYLMNFKEKFTRYELANVSGMTSGYGVRIYEMLAQYRKIGRREFTLEWLKQRLEIDNVESYRDLSNFKKRVIDAAVTDINKHTDLTVHPPIYMKTGRNVTGVVFDFKQKQTRQAAKVKEVATPKAPEQQVDNVQYFVDTLNGLRGNIELRNKIIQSIPPEIMEQVLSRVTV